MAEVSIGKLPLCDLDMSTMMSLEGIKIGLDIQKGQPKSADPFIWL